MSTVAYPEGRYYPMELEQLQSLVRGGVLTTEQVLPSIQRLVVRRQKRLGRKPVARSRKLKPFRPSTENCPPPDAQSVLADTLYRYCRHRLFGTPREYVRPDGSTFWIGGIARETPRDKRDELLQDAVCQAFAYIDRLRKKNPDWTYQNLVSGASKRGSRRAVDGAAGRLKSNLIGTDEAFRSRVGPLRVQSKDRREITTSVVDFDLFTVAMRDATAEGLIDWDALDLTEQQGELVVYLMAGMSGVEIAAKWHASTPTVSRRVDALRVIITAHLELPG